MRVAFLGTGLLGSELARSMSRRGLEVRAWNRTFEKALALEEEGAKAFERAADAVREAPVVHIALRDDATVDAVLESIAGCILPDAIIIDHSTTVPGLTHERICRWAGRGVAYIHAPVFMSPRSAREQTGIMLLSGDAEVRQRARPLLEPMTGRLIELGDDPTNAARFKLMGNLLMLVAVAGLGEMYAFADCLGIPRQEAHHLLSFFSLDSSIAGRAESMAQNDYRVQWSLSMARKDVAIILHEVETQGITLKVLSAVAAVFDQYLTSGDGRLDVAVISKR